MRAPQNKHESIDLFARGRYGNTLPTWNTLEEALASDCQLFTIRYKGEPGVQGPAIFEVPRHMLITEYNLQVRAGWKKERLYTNQAIDPSTIVLQGELMLNHDDGWLFRGSERPGIHMREAMKEAKTWRGWQARELLRTKDASVVMGGFESRH